jgi:hypothetical protein
VEPKHISTTAQTAHVLPVRSRSQTAGMGRWKSFLGRSAPTETESGQASGPAPYEDVEDRVVRPSKWGLGILNDRDTDEVPGSILLLSKETKRNEPLGLQHTPARTSSSSLPSPFLSRHRSRSQTPTRPVKKKTSDGRIVLDPQPDDSHNDPLNWALWRRNAALLSLGYYCAYNILVLHHFGIVLNDSRHARRWHDTCSRGWLQQCSYHL